MKITWNGEDDYLPPEALKRILTLTEQLPADFDMGSTQGYTKSIQANFRFPVVGPTAQFDALTKVLTASQFLGTTARNLAHVRDYLDHHMDAKTDPCQNRGVEWPCDVANALMGKMGEWGE